MAVPALPAPLPVPVPANALAAHTLAAMPPNTANVLQTCGRTRKRTRAAENAMCAAPGPTDSQDLVALIVAENEAIAAAGGVPAGAPAWAAPIFTTLAALTATLAAHTATLARIDVNLHNLTARQQNLFLRDPQHRINAIWVWNGTTSGVPAGVAFPATVRACDGLTAPQARALLAAYGAPALPAGIAAADARTRVRQFLGMITSPDFVPRMLGQRTSAVPSVNYRQW